MQNNCLTIIESWNLSWIGILVDIQHSLDGLAPGTLLQSEETGKKWEVASRIIYYQVEGTKRFKNEKETLQRFTFRPAESIEIFEKKIKENEAKGIYSYNLKPIDHSDKPMIGEKLIVLSY